MRYATCFSGIGAPEVAWKGLGWEQVWSSEIEPFPCAVLAHHYPNVPNLGDINLVHQNAKQTQQHLGPVDLICGGSPCQSFSLAGLRKGLDDPRGNLMLVYAGVVERFRPRWFVWENVPGVLSSNKGRDFQCFLATMAEIGYRCAWRVLDAQYFGVPQRRRRVFVVGHLTDWRRAAAVLFERQGVSGYSTQIESKKQGITPAVAEGSRKGGGYSLDDLPMIANTLTGGSNTKSNYGKRNGSDRDNLIVATLDASFARLQGCSGQDLGHGHSHLVSQPALYGGNNTSGEIKVHPALNAAKSGSRRMDFESEAFVVFQSKASATQSQNPGAVSPTLDKSKTEGISVFAQNTRDEVREMKVVGALAANPGMKQTSYLRLNTGVRRITPLEAERLQGFPDHYTLISYRKKRAADGPRYKAIGNSMAVPVMKWIGERIAFVDSL